MLLIMISRSSAHAQLEVPSQEKYVSLTLINRGMASLTGIHLFPPNEFQARMIAHQYPCTIQTKKNMIVCAIVFEHLWDPHLVTKKNRRNLNARSVYTCDNYHGIRDWTTRIRKRRLDCARISVLCTSRLAVAYTAHIVRGRGQSLVL